jgi:hypothetical protein
VKEFLQEELRRPSVVTTPQSGIELFDVTRTSLDQSFEGWLHAMRATEGLNMSAPAVFIDTPLASLTRAPKRALQLCPPVEAESLVSVSLSDVPSRMTTQDYVQVMLATVREGRRHARWPKEVLEHFLAAEVVTDSSQ